MKQLLDQYLDLVRAGPPGLFSRGDKERLERHVEDGVVGAEHVAALAPTSIVDIGSGGGIPGLPLATTCTDARVHLVESLGWKAGFLEAVAASLSLDSRLTVHCIRAEEAVVVLGREAIDVGTARAVATPPVVAEYLAPLVRVGGHLALWTTRSVAETHLAGSWLEQLGLGDGRVLEAATTLRAEGVLLLLPKVAACAERFPRRTGVASRRPLA